MDLAFELLCALRQSPESLARERFLSAIGERLLALAQRFDDPEEVAQRTHIEVARTWRSCRASCPGQLASWLRRLVWTQGRRAMRRHSPPPESAPPTLTPDEVISNRARGQALEAAVMATEGIVPAELPARHRAWARAHGVAASNERIRRDLEVLLLVRRDGLSHAEAAARLGLTLAVAKKATSRGAAALVLAARVLAEHERDPWVREALLEIAQALRR
jgi:DNA-directed RNA polymerase specialized sigma24 family protein